MLHSIKTFFANVFEEPIYPILMGIAFIGLLFAHNYRELALSELVDPFAYFLIACCAGLALFKFVYKDWNKSAVVMSVAISIFFLYGHIRTIAADFLLVAADLVGYWLSDDQILSLLLVVLFGAVTLSLLLSDMTVPPAANKIANIVALGLVLGPLVTIAQVTAGEIGGHEAVQEAAAAGQLGAATSAKQPDIYYFIFDRYASNQTLADFYGFDNSGMTDFLGRQGFYVAEDSWTNYPRTDFSLASSLNMDYFHNFAPLKGGRVEAETVIPALKNHRVGQLLTARGYQYIHVSTWYEPTRTNPLADVVVNRNSNPLQLSAFQRLLVGQSFAAPILDSQLTMDEFEAHVQGVEYQIEKMPGIIVQHSPDSPKFVFAHILLPHSPVVFDRDCRPLNRQQMEKPVTVEGYLVQLQCANRIMKQLVTAIMEHDDTSVIVIQADEGPRAFKFKPEGRDDYSFAGVPEAMLEERGRILNAYYLPGVDMEAVLSPEMSPVNTFRIIFNQYFGAGYELLPNKTYVWPDSDRLDEMVERRSRSVDR